ncbi:hypothetical protein KSP39_PZI000932 [Platanthera zijinensis]|uniref:Uncharacterized protein n=1 Tax=Platanthera zijinensis TaxID=2320716 RepID=A0AAP0C2T4_9ASPA
MLRVERSPPGAGGARRERAEPAVLGRILSREAIEAVGDAREIEETEDPGKRSLDWLISVSPPLSLEQIDSTYQESGDDAYNDADILGAELVDPKESPNSYGKKRSVHKKKRVVASTGIVSGVIGKDHWKSGPSCSGRRRGLGDPMKAKEQRAVWAYNCEGSEEFLCSMISSDSNPGMGGRKGCFK